MIKIYKSIFVFSFFILSVLGNTATYYWVNNGGDWNDSFHWSYSSGGNGGAGVPSSNDNIIFDENSFTSELEKVKFSSSVEINNFTISNAIRFKLISDLTFPFTINGNWNTNNFKNELKGPIVFKGNGNHTLNFKNQFISDIKFQGSGNFEINNDLITDKNIYFNKGQINLNAKAIKGNQITVGNNSNLFVDATDSYCVTDDLILPNHSNQFIAFNPSRLIQISNSGNLPMRGTNSCGSPLMTITTYLGISYNGYGVSCNGATDGIVCITVVGGVGPFFINWLDPTATDGLYGTGVECFSGVGAGTYSVLVTDQGQGSAPFFVTCGTSQAVVEPGEISLITMLLNDPTCNGDCDGSATPIIFDDLPIVSYSWNNGNETTPTAVMLCTGQNSLTTIDANGCQFDTTFFILTPTVVLPNVTTSNVSCFGVCDGDAYSTPTGGNGAPYTFSWSNGDSGPGPITDSTNNLCAGNYSVTVLDFNGCPGTQNFTITQPNQIILSVVSQTNLVCNGICSGAINISTANGTAPYSYQWFNATTGLPIAGQTNEDATNFCAGTYFVQVTDANGCQDVSPNVTLTQPPAITSTPSATNIQCFGQCNGVLSVVSAGGTGVHTYTWFNAATGLPVGNGNPLGGMCAGNYFVEVTDANNCIANSIVVTITEPSQLTLLVNDNDVLCNSLCTGSASAIVGGGTGALTINWFSLPGNINIGSGANINGLCDGNYYAEVTDGNSCTDTVQFTISEPTPLTVVTETFTDVQCFNACDGTTTFDVSGGTPGYTIEWFDANTNLTIGQFGVTASGLCPGDYYAIATDANGCTIQSITFTITEPTTLTSTITATDVSCNGVCDGTADLVISGGTSPYTITWFDSSNNPIGQSSDPAVGLCPGDYYAIITDANGCSFTTNAVTVNDQIAVTGVINTTDASCNGVCDGQAVVTPFGGVGPFTYTWSSSPNTTDTEINICAGNYDVSFVDANGCPFGPINFTINEPTAITFTFVTTDISCFGLCDGSADVSNISGATPPYTLSWSSSANTGSTESNLCPGNYTLTITGQAGCDTIHNFTINEPTALVLAPNFADPTCTGACDGTASANPSGGTPPYSFSWVDLNNGPLATTTDTITNLCPGDYEVTVTDANGCTQITTFNLIDPPGMTATTSPTAAACGTVCDGQVDLTIVGGQAPYTITWMDATSGSAIGQSSDPAINLCAGNYYAIISDVNGCSVISDTAVVTQIIVVTGTMVVTDPSCFGFCNGSINLTPAGGVPPYTYQWFDQSTGLPIGQSIEDPVGLCAGDYYVIITESNGCSSAPLIETLTEPTQITIQLTGTDATCFNLCNGSISAIVAGGNPPYTFQWFNASTGNPIGQSTQNASNLCDGNYELVVTDATGCTVTSTTVTINEPTAISTTLTTTNASCFNVCDGIATLTTNGGTSPYTFTWSSSGNTTDTETGLCDGNYTVSVTDAAGCNAGPFNFTITEPTAVSGSTTNGTVSCFGGCNGSVSAIPSGGTAPYSYLWNDPSSQTGSTASGLCAGNFNVIITDANGCSSSPINATVTQPAAITLTTITSNDATCGGICDGTATVTVSGGTSPYSYQWDDALNQTTQTAIALCAGSYNVTVTDANGCIVGPFNINVNEPNTLNITLTVTDESCFGLCNGSIDAVINGGTAPITVQWDDPTLQTTTTASSLCGGTYTIDVTDANGCTASASETVIDAVDITATSSSTQAQCGVCDGTATINPSGGTGSFNIQWDAAAANQTGLTASALCAGVYQVTVTDGNGCAAVFSAAVSNPNGEVISVSSTDASCDGNCDGTATVAFNCTTPVCTILWNDPSAQTTNTATGLCAGSYGVTVTNGAGCITADVVTINEPNLIQPNLTATDVICAGDCNGTIASNATGGDGNYTFLWDDPSTQTTPAAVNLCNGTYTLIVTDGNGCTGTASAIVNDPSVPLSASTSSNDANCNAQCDGIATVFPVGGVAPYTFQWDDPAAQTTQQATGLCAGTYNVTVVDAAGCTFGPLTVTINEPTAITGNISATNINCNGNCNGTATVNLAGGTAPYSFVWDDPLAQTTQTAVNLCAGTYTAIATDANGCAGGNFSVTIAEPTALTLSSTSVNADCNGLCNGTATVTPVGGTLPYTILWNDPSSQNTATAFNLCAGNYTVTVTDANGCSGNNVVTITAPSILNSNSSSTDVSCFSLCDGVAIVNPSGGSAPYTFLWSNGNTSSSISNLCPGNYDVDITDVNGCFISDNFTIIEPTEITASINTSDATCGVCNGSVAVSPSGGVGPYTYLWDVAAGSGTTQNASNLCSGIYSVDVTDATGCTVTIGTSISDFNGETVTTNSTDASCFGICDGTADASSPCVNAPCSFEWYDGAGATTGVTTNAITNLCADNYFVEVINSLGCVTIEMVTINEPLEIEGNGVVTDATCGTICDGQVAIAPTGGTGVFTFQWNDPSSQTTQTATGLCGGNVDVDITSGGCTITETYFVNQPLTLNASVNTQLDAQCNGDCNGAADLNVTDGTSPYTFAWDDPSTQTTQAAINLCAGNYNATVTDANGCNVVVPVTINEPAILNAAVSSTDVDCFGNCNGTGTVVPAGGNPPYTIQWNDPGLQTTATATGLCAGTYDVVVTDASLCATLPQTITVNENPVLSFSSVTTGISCNSFCDGTITINAAGGDGNYTYSIDGGGSFQVSNLFSNVCGGSYTVVVVDGSGCSSSANVNVNQPSQLGGSVVSFNATCNTNNGSANAVPTGGTPNYTFIWMDASLNPIGQITQAATGLGAGIYNVQITDANGCSTTLTAIISNFNAPTITVNTITEPICNGDCNGAIDMDVTGGTPGYTYQWFNGGQISEDLANICAGNYLLQVTDAAGCISFGNASLTEPTILDVTFAVTDAGCGLCDGSAIATPSGGDGNYTIDWTNGQTGTNATNLCAGAYGVQISDGAGCLNTINFAVSNPTGPTGENIVTTDVSCFGVCDGTADVTPIGGTAPYTFFWPHDGSTTSNVNSLCGGTYFCEITDANGCIRMATIIINGATQMTDSTVITPADCGVCNGQLSVFMTGGNGPFTYQWDAAAGNATTSIVSNLCEGLYTLVVTDGNGCTQNFSFYVNGKNAPTLSISTTDANCNGTCDGTATVTITGGVGPFAETWLDDVGTNLGLSGTTVNTLCGGDYWVEILDQNTGCLNAIYFTIDQPENLQFSLPFTQDNSCFNSCDGILTAIVIQGTLPYTYTWNDPSSQTTASATSLCAGNYDVTVTDANGCTGTQQGTINEPTAVTMAFNITDASCSTVADGAIDVTAAGGAGGYNYSWTGPNSFTSSNEDLTNIFTGMYYLTVTDANGCSFLDSAFVNATVIVNAFAGNDTTICGNVPNFTVNGSGGLTYEWYDTTGVLLASTQSYSFVPSAGTTTLILFAYDGLCTDSDTINIIINPIPTVNAGPDVFTLAGVGVQIGGNPTAPAGSTFDWSNGIYLSDSTSSNPMATVDSTTTFIVTAIDVNGCIGTDTMLVQILPPIFIPNGFSPNGDGNNDLWIIDYIDQFPDCQVEVYNRWGQLLFLSNGYLQPWDGTYNNQIIPIGTYYYIINLNHPLFPDAYTGPLTILR